MALSSSRQAIANALVYVMQNIIDPNTSAALYPLVKLGAVYDPGTKVPFAQVTHYQGKGEPAGSGGFQTGWRIDDEITYLITSGFGPYQTDDSVAQSDMLYAQDLVLPALHTHFQLPNASNPTIAVQSVYSVLPTLADRSAPLKWPNGQVYLLWHVPVIVKQQYDVVLVSP